MPLLEFTCGGCAHSFEELVLRGETPACPECGGARLEKLVSSFGVTGGQPEIPSPGSCGTCGDPAGPGSCSLD